VEKSVVMCDVMNCELMGKEVRKDRTCGLINFTL
jgi:hypothetical protein